VAFVKNSVFMTTGQFEWSEVYYDMSSTLVGSTDSIARTRALGVARANMLGQGAVVYAIRQSLDNSPRATQTIFADDNGNTPWTPSNNTSILGAVGVAQNPEFGVVTEVLLSSYPWRGIRHMGGIPSGAMIGPENIVGGSITGNTFNFNRWFKAFSDFVGDGTWGINCKAVGASKLPITAITQVAGTNFLSITTNGAVGVVPRQQIQIRGAKYNVKVPKVNGLHTVLSISNTGSNFTYVCSPAVNIPQGATWSGGGTAEAVSKVVLAISKLNALETRAKKRGERSKGSPGPARK
jgi:hypothetical protein